MKNVFITGAASGIGFEIARRFGRAGHEIFITDINAVGLRKAVNQLAEEGIHANYKHMDVSKWYQVTDVISDVPLPDVLINNAGVGYNGEMANMTIDDWERLISVNLIGPINHICAFLPSMIKRGNGHIVNVSSGQAFFRLPTWGAYAAIKTALGVISEVLSYEISKYNIKVTTVYPFMVDTPFYREVTGDTKMAELSMKLLPYYSNTPEQVADKIFDAVEKGKKIEMVNPLNWVGFAIRACPPISSMVTYLTNKLLAKGK